MTNLVLFFTTTVSWLTGDVLEAEVLVAQSCPLFVTPRTVAGQALLPMKFSRQEYWSGLPFPSPGDLPDPGGIKHRSAALQAGSLLSEPHIISI